MKIELDKDSLIDLVKGSQPNYGVQKESPIKELGSWSVGIGEKWWWRHSSVALLSEQELYNVHMTCKNSWK